MALSGGTRDAELLPVALAHCITQLPGARFTELGTQCGCYLGFLVTALLGTLVAGNGNRQDGAAYGKEGREGACSAGWKD